MKGAGGLNSNSRYQQWVYDSRVYRFIEGSVKPIQASKPCSAAAHSAHALAERCVRSSRTTNEESFDCKNHSQFWKSLPISEL